MPMGLSGTRAVASFVVTFAATRERVQPVQQKASAMKDDLKDLMRNLPWIMVCFIGLFAVCYFSIRMGAVLYYFKHYVGSYHFEHRIAGHSFNYRFDSGSMASLFMALGTAGVISGAPRARPLAQRLGGQRQAYMLRIPPARLPTRP